jgi:hypothetical protein
MTLGQNLIISDTVHLEGLKAKEIGTYQTSPKGQLCGRAYEVAVNGTQQTINSTSATAKLRISRLVVLRICLLKVTTKITKLFPRKPIRHTILKHNRVFAVVVLSDRAHKFSVCIQVNIFRRFLSFTILLMNLNVNFP